MPHCPHCQRSLLFADSWRKVERKATLFQRPQLSSYLCPFCGQAVRPRRLALSRMILWLGILGLVPGALWLAITLAQPVALYAGIAPNGMLKLLAVVLGAAGMLLPFWLAKAVVRYDLPAADAAPSGGTP
ncbi:MAG: hypothetical protein V4582_08780 [Pseudomonadota bacterium]